MKRTVAALLTGAILAVSTAAFAQTAPQDTSRSSRPSTTTPGTVAPPSISTPGSIKDSSRSSVGGSIQDSSQSKPGKTPYREKTEGQKKP